MDQVYNTRPGIFTVDQVSNPIPKQLVTSTALCPSSLVVPLVWQISTVACRVGCRVTTGTFSFPVAWIEPSGTTKASQQGGSFHVCLIPLCPSKKHVVFSVIEPYQSVLVGK